MARPGLPTVSPIKRIFKKTSSKLSKEFGDVDRIPNCKNSVNVTEFLFAPLGRVATTYLNLFKQVGALFTL